MQEGDAKPPKQSDYLRTAAAKDIKQGQSRTPSSTPGFTSLLRANSSPLADVSFAQQCKGSHLKTGLHDFTQV